jgi:hypothetical protein
VCAFGIGITIQNRKNRLRRFGRFASEPDVSLPSQA